MQFSVKSMLPKQVKIEVSLMISPTVNAFKRVVVWFSLFCFKSGQINFEILLATPRKMPVMFTLVRPVALDTL